MKRAATLEFGAVPVGKHSIAELASGQVWRLGMNEASTLRLDMPLLAGESMIAPGSYRVQLQRTGDAACSLLVNGSGLALAEAGDGKIEGALGKAGKATKKLDIQWRKKGAAAGGTQPAQVVVQFGPDEWVGDMAAIGNKPIQLQGWKIVLFQVPIARLEAGTPTPVATFTRGDENWNLVVAKDDVRLVPWMTAPTEQFGFGEVKAPDAAKVVTGRMGKLEMKVDAPMEQLEHLATRREGKDIHLSVGYGKERVSWIVPEPKARQGK